MNQRIKELEQQAMVFRAGMKMLDTEKFAELIVRECIEVIDMTHGSKKLMRPDPYQKIIWAIEEHFGVES
jgi:2-hydroxy-3-keto-5-methylthiopentenyl-1-phosphate phosphatase